ncbi:MAG: SAP domain-containing protein, partial [Candidatus Thermoplasmatota archaeon]|nr:SAP domain-containing protein [Candidatus Thermoplasmatota archaeon]
MAPGDSLDRSSLNSMTVAELRGICKDRGLFVSGKKSELVDRISADIGEDDELIVNEEEVVEALIMEDDDTAESETEHSELIEEVLSRLKEEVVEAEVVGVEGEINDVVLPEERPPERTVTGGEDDAPSIVIPIPTLESMQRRWKTVAAVAAVAILVGALATTL